MVDYPLVPEADCTETTEISLDIYKYFNEDPSQNIILMGDSAGAGLALALAQRIRNETDSSYAEEAYSI